LSGLGDIGWKKAAAKTYTRECNLGELDTINQQLAVSQSQLPAQLSKKIKAH
jgi:hypothetical protein